MNISATAAIDALIALLGERGVLHDARDLERYTTDWGGCRLGAPLAVARPQSTEEVAAVVNKDGVAIKVVDGGLDHQIA